MGASTRYLNRAVTAVCSLWLAVGAAAARADDAQLLKDLKSNDPGTWQRAQVDLEREWSSSGSPAMDLLLQRGIAALLANDPRTAVDHLSALVDHAPDFAEGYAMRARAFQAQGDFGPALNDLARALTLNPNNYVAIAELGGILEATGNRKDALAAYKMSTAILPHQPEVLDAIKRLEARTNGQEL
jgi:tetratricopeptide (TPR) repeat protein